MIDQLWFSKETLPPFPPKDYEYYDCLTSISVLIRCSDGKMYVGNAYLEDNGKINWYDNSDDYYSEITNTVTHWTYLPEFKGVINDTAN